MDLRNMNKIMTGKINCPDLLREVRWYSPVRRPRRQSLTVTFNSPHRINLRGDSFFPRTHRLLNTLPADFDIYESNTNTFKRAVKKLHF